MSRFSHILAKIFAIAVGLGLGTMASFYAQPAFASTTNLGMYNKIGTTSSNPATVDITVTGSNALLIASISGEDSTGAFYTNQACTFDGVSMTWYTGYKLSTYPGVIFYLTNPHIGTNLTLSCSWTSGATFATTIAGAVFYGADMVNPLQFPNYVQYATGTGTATTSSALIVPANTLGIAFVWANSTSASTGQTATSPSLQLWQNQVGSAGTTQRNTTAMWAQSGPAGSLSFNGTLNNNQTWYSVGFFINPGSTTSLDTTYYENQNFTIELLVVVASLFLCILFLIYLTVLIK